MSNILQMDQNVVVLELSSQTDDIHLHLTALAPSPITAIPVTDYQGVAAVPILAHRLLRITPYGLSYLDATDANQAQSCLGVSLTAALAGGEVRYRNAGVIKNDGWSFPVGAIIYAGDGGLLSLTSGLGFFQRVGVAISPTEVQLSIGTAIIRAS